MIGTAKRQENKKFSIAMDQLLNEIITYGPDSPEYPVLLKQLKQISKLRTASSPTKRVSPDTVVLAAGNLAGILVIVAYEQKHVMVSAAQKFLLKAH